MNGNFSSLLPEIESRVAMGTFENGSLTSEISLWIKDFCTDFTFKL
jgi:hypothetical protein